jgi:acyl dehydratase
MSVLDAPIGQALPPLVKPPIELSQLRRYAEASGDYNPIHMDEEIARRVGLDGVIAHGMLSMAFLGQFISQQIKDNPEAKVEHLKVRFASMVRLGDVLTCHGIIKDRVRRDGFTSTTIECWAQNQKGEKVTVGEAVIVVPVVEDKERD